MTTESIETTVLPPAELAPAAPVEIPASQAKPVEDAPAAPAEAPVAVVEQAPAVVEEVALAPSEPEEVALTEEFQAAPVYDEYEGNTPPVAHRPAYAGPEPRPTRDIPGRA